MKKQNGFTLIELLIVIAILGILAAVIVPNVKSFLTSGTISAANQEVSSLQTAQQAYSAEHGGVYAAGNSSLSVYLTGTPKATYTFDTTTGSILTAVSTTGGWGTTITFDTGTQQWKRAP